jgi:hypothetical protein
VNNDCAFATTTNDQDQDDEVLGQLHHEENVADNASDELGETSSNEESPIWT